MSAKLDKTKPERVQEALGEYPGTHGVTLGDAGPGVGLCDSCGSLPTQQTL